MTQDQENQRRQILEHTIGSVWSHGWTRRRIDAYAMAVRNYPPNSVQAGCDLAIREWTGDYAPSPAKLREFIEATRTQPLHREPRGEGAGCPTCRREYQPGEHAHWVSNGSLVACHEHNFMWPGSLPDEPDPGELPEGEWRRRAARGDYGRVCQTIAEQGGRPADLIPTITPDIDHDLRRERAQATP